MASTRRDGRAKVLAATDPNIRHAAEIVLAGGVIVAPSDTNMALTRDAWNEAAVRRAFAIKRRPATSPLTLFMRAPGDWPTYTEVPDVDRPIVQALAGSLWPGPLNIVLPRDPQRVPDFIVCGGSTVALGVLSNPTVQRLLDFIGRPVAMTSANLSGQASGVLVDVAMAHDQIGDAVDLILEGGKQGTTTSSTIVKVDNGRLTILRQGDIQPQTIRETLAGLPVELAF
ncbi:L-threonylcarbamoyladenylate synthase [Actinobaculum sp. 352]|uniref:L-threonylcarbamoyladenylate synthase n=1 Tax=Actinobaculum sp. 352 TaxID=2490946 RepID=UPI000F7F131D|nr:L-threonylcarbamoyladenylate synthase [Actinobaculum sp. 352]RTE49191.1 threonylcarbamoyl-AMP synthase [Actinobaculum sp. 352]